MTAPTASISSVQRVVRQHCRESETRTGSGCKSGPAQAGVELALFDALLAHELAHHVHADLWRGLALEAFIIGLGLWAGDYALRAARGGLYE